MIESGQAVPRRSAVAAVGALVVVLLVSGLGAAAVVARHPVDVRVHTIGVAGSVTGAIEPPATATTTTMPAVVPSPTVPPTSASSTTFAPVRRSTTTSAAAQKPTSGGIVTQTPTWTTPTTAPLPPLPVPVTGPPSTTNGTGTWSTVSNGISIDLRMEPVAPRVGDNVHFTVTASYPTDYCCVTAFYFGDGTFVPPALGSNPCPAPHPSVFHQEVDHIYTGKGAFTVEVQPSSFGLCTPGSPTVVNAQLYVTIFIGPAA